MRKRQVKKFAKNAKKNFMPYRAAMRGGSKKLDRRRRAFGRHTPGGLASWDQGRRDTMKLKTLLKQVDGVSSWEDAGPIMLSAVNMLSRRLDAMTETAS